MPVRIKNKLDEFKKFNDKKGIQGVGKVKVKTCVFATITLTVFLFLFLCSLTGTASADLPKYIKEQLHGDIRYQVVTERNLNWLKKLKPGTKPVNFVVVQAKPESFREEDSKAILDWVKSGGIVWFYDSRLADHFGMKNAPYDRDEIRGKDHTGGYGTGSVKGMNVIANALPFADHEVVTGVRNIQVFLIEIEKDKFSAVSSETKGLIPLFAANLEKKCVIALKKHGKGWIIFKPLLWPKVLGGERFQVNLKEFSAGYPVPKAEKPVIPMEAYKGKSKKLKRYDSLILTDGNQYLGMVMDKKFTFIGGDGKVEKNVDKIESITIDGTGDKIELRNGEKHTGTLLALSIELKTTTGKKLKIEKDKIKSIVFDIGEKK